MPLARGFVRFDLASGEFPETGQRLAFATLSAQHLTVADDGCAYNVDDVAWLLLGWCCFGHALSHLRQRKSGPGYNGEERICVPTCAAAHHIQCKNQEKPRLPNHSGRARAYSVTCVLAVMATIEGNGKRQPPIVVMIAYPLKHYFAAV